MRHLVPTLALAIVAAAPANAGSLTASELATSWIGVHHSESLGYQDESLSLTFAADGTYVVESQTGTLQSRIYPGSEAWTLEDDGGTLHLSWLNTVYAGQRFYDDVYFEVDHFEDGELRLVYKRFNGEVDPSVLVVELVDESWVDPGDDPGDDTDVTIDDPGVDGSDDPGDPPAGATASCSTAAGPAGLMSVLGGLVLLVGFRRRRG